MLRSVTCTVFLLLLALASVESKRRLKVLVYSTTFSYSHVAFNGRLAEILKNAGHEVHLLLPITIPDMPYDGTGKAHRIFRPSLAHSEEIIAELSQITAIADPFQGTQNFVLDGSVGHIVAADYYVAKDIIEDTDLIETLRREKYDVGIAEAIVSWPFGLFHLLGIPTTFGTSPLPMSHSLLDEFGIPAPSSFVPAWATMVTVNGDRMNMWERAQNTYFNALQRHGVDSMFRKLQKLFYDAHDPEFPGLELLVRNMSYLFVNSNPLFDIARPTSAKVVPVAGIVHSNKASSKALTTEITEIIDRPSKGVVFFSLGTLTNTQQMPPTLRNAFLDAFAEFPDYHFIWKDSNSSGIVRPSNVHFVDWVNQAALLAHPKLKAFVTHCGLNSVNEAADSGVPLVTMPLFGDQLYNAAIAKSRGVSVNLDVRHVTKEAVVDALKAVLEEPSYRENAQLLGRKLKTYPLRPEEQFVQHVEFAAEFPPLVELNLRGAELSFITYFNLDLFAVIIAFAVVAYLFSVRVLRLLSSTLSEAKNKSE